jgi:hypothetical protein
MMNKRIAQLARQAGFELNPVHFDHEKFAELIVREVFEMIDYEQFEMYPPVAQRVKERFGIGDE